MMSIARNLYQRGMDLASGPIARGSITSVVIKVTGIGLAFLQAVIAARLLGAEGYGLVAVALAVAQIGATVAVFGFNTLSVREIAGWLANGTTNLLAPFTCYAVATVLAISAFIAGAIGCIYTFGTDWLGEYANVLLISALIIPGWALIQLLRGIAQGFGDVAGAQWPGEILRPALVILSVLGSLAFVPAFTAETFLLLYTAAAFAGVVVATFIVRKHISAHIGEKREQVAEPNWFVKSVPFFGLSVSAVLLGELATLMLAVFATPEQAGLYQPIARLTPIFALPAAAATMRYAPRISEFWYSDQIERLVRITRTFVLATTAITTLATLAIASLGYWLLLIFGADFTVVASLLWIVGAAQIFDAACGPAGPILMMTGKSRLALGGYFTGVVVNAVLGLALIPENGATGAAISVAGGIVATNVFLLWAVCRYNGFDPSIFSATARFAIRPQPMKDQHD